jgi:hypothetical protein
MMGLAGVAAISRAAASSAFARALDEACVRLRNSPPSIAPPFSRQNLGADIGS